MTSARALPDTESPFRLLWTVSVSANLLAGQRHRLISPGLTAFQLETIHNCSLSTGEHVPVDDAQHQLGHAGSLTP